MFLPPDIVKGRHVYFAIDNIDFSEDTPDGKRTLHGTAMAIYQKVESQDEEPVLRYHNCSTKKHDALISSQVLYGRGVN